MSAEERILDSPEIESGRSDFPGFMTMVENQDVEKNAGEYADAKPSSPLVPKSSHSFEKERVYPDPSGWQMVVQIPRDQVIPTKQVRRSHSRPRSRRNSCSRYLCCTLCFLIALVAIIAIAARILYLVVQPRIPKYSVESIRISNFSINADLTTNCQFAVNVSAQNPNKKMGIYYLDNSHLAVSYSGTELCTGSLPVFYQGHKNTAFLDVELNGIGARLTSAMVSALNEQRKQGSVPLNLKAEVPVKIKLGKLKSLKIKVHVKWDLVVDRLDANAKVISEKSKVSLKL